MGCSDNAEINRLNFILLRQISLLGAGTGGAQAIAFVFSPLITRLYGPEVYGLLGSYMALTLLLLPLVSLTFPVAVVLADSATLTVVLAFQ